jgi:hypothetical protein
MLKKEILFSFLLFYLTGITLISCSPAYYKFTQQYQVTRDNLQPDYSDLYYWASHPAKKDPADSVSRVFKNETRDTVADVFFIHPTTYTGDTTDGLNADIHNAMLNAKTDYSPILYQASAFNQHARIFAPRYRQAHISCFSMNNSARAKAAFDTAYEDVKNAFLYYINHENHGRPFIIASHSQGTIHAGRLLKELVEHSPLKQQLVACYLIGIVVPENYFTSLPPCQNETATGCFVTWRTYRYGYLPEFIEKETFKAVVVNPLTWTTTSELVPKEKNTGAILYDFNKVFPHTNDAQVAGNVLWAHKPRFPGSFLYRTRNYHIGDINLFYLNIRNNVEVRLTNYLNESDGHSRADQ